LDRRRRPRRPRRSRGRRDARGLWRGGGRLCAAPRPRRRASGEGANSEPGRSRAPLRFPRRPGAPSQQQVPPVPRARSRSEESSFWASCVRSCWSLGSSLLPFGRGALVRERHRRPAAYSRRSDSSGGVVGVVAMATTRARPYARPAGNGRHGPSLMARTLDPARLGDHLDRLYRAAWALCGSREQAADLVQATHPPVLGRPRLLRNEDDLGYLLRALRNTFLNQKRAERRRLRPDPLPEQLDLVTDPHARDPNAALEVSELYAAVAALPDDFRDVLVAVDI